MNEVILFTPEFEYQQEYLDEYHSSSYFICVSYETFIYKKNENGRYCCVDDNNTTYSSTELYDAMKDMYLNFSTEINECIGNLNYYREDLLNCLSGVETHAWIEYWINEMELWDRE